MCVPDWTTLLLPTERLTLRATRPSDARRIAELAADFDVARMTVRMPHPYTEKDAEGFLARMEEPGRLAVETSADGLVGVLGFHDLDAHGAPKIGYWLGKPFWGRGYATEAVRAALAWAGRTWKRRLVRASHFADNAASAQVLIKAGFLYTGDVTALPCASRGGPVAARRMVWLA